MKNSRWTVPAAAFCVLALSAYGCASDPAIDEDEDGTGSSSGKPKADAGKTDAGKSSSSGGGSSGRSSSSGGSNTSSGGISSSGDVDTDAGDDDDSGASSSSSGALDSGTPDSGGNGGDCTEITPAQWAATNLNRFAASFLPLPAGATSSQMTLTFYTAAGSGADPAVGNYDLGSVKNRSFASCEQCILAEGIAAGQPTVTFFQSAGALKVTAGAASSITATLTGVKLVEVESDGNDYVAVPDGKCVTVRDGAVNVAAP